MKRILTLLLVLIGLNGNTQVVDGINYQAVALDEDGREIPGTDINGNVLAESMFDVRFTIRSATNDGTIQYQETHADVNTDNFGLFTVVIGHGSTTTLSPVAMLNDIDWGADKHFLEVEIDLEQDGNYKLMSNQQMMAVPYAFYALNVGDVEWGNISDVPADLLDGDNVDDADNDPSNELQDWTTLPGIPAGLADGVDDVDDADNDPTNELQIISISNDTIYLTNGGFAVIPQSTSVDWTNITNIPADILDGDNVDDADNDPTNELQDWSTLPGIPADILDGDNVDDADNDPTNEITTVTDNGDGTSTLTDALGGTVTVDNDGIDNVDDADNDPTNELQTLSLSNDTLYLSNGNSVYLGNLSGGGSGGSAPVGTISYPMANHMFYTPTNGFEGELVVSGNTSMDGVYNFTKFHLESSGVINIGSEAFLLIKADTIIIDGTINGSGLWANEGTGGGAGGGGGGIAHTAYNCFCAGNSGYNSGYKSGFETLTILSGGDGGGATLATFNGAPGQSCDTSSILVAIDLNLTMKGSRGMDGKLSCGGTCNFTSRLGGNGGAGIIFVSNYVEINNSAIIDISGSNGANYGGGSGGGGNLIIKSNQFGALNGTIDVSGGISSLSSGVLGKGGNGGDGLVLFITP